MVGNFEGLLEDSEAARAGVGGGSPSRVAVPGHRKNQPTLPGPSGSALTVAARSPVRVGHGTGRGGRMGGRRLSPTTL